MSRVWDEVFCGEGKTPSLIEESARLLQKDSRINACYYEVEGDGVVQAPSPIKFQGEKVELAEIEIGRVNCPDDRELFLGRRRCLNHVR